jgi:hypothetical protein
MHKQGAIGMKWLVRRDAWPAVERRFQKTIRPAEPKSCGPNWGLELATLSFPCTCVGRLAFAGRKFPDATLRGMRRFRSHGGIAATVSGCCLSSEASMPGSVALCREQLAGQGADTPAMVTFASAPVPRGRLTAFGRTLASRDGSDLLPLRLLLCVAVG